MDELQKLLEALGQIRAEMTEIHEAAAAEDRDLTDEESEKYEALKARYQAKQAERERLEDLRTKKQSEDAAGASASRAGGGSADPDAPRLNLEPRNAREEEVHRRHAMSAWFRTGAQCRDAEVARLERNACERFNMDPQTNEVLLDFSRSERRSVRNVDGTEYRAQTSEVGADGGFLVPTESANAFDDAMLAFGGLARWADTIRTPTAADFSWPGGNDTANEGEILGQGVASTKQQVAFTEQVWKAYRFSSKYLKVSMTLLRDAMIPIESYILAKLAERIARRQARAFATGTGASEPRGIVTASILGITTAASTVITADELDQLKYSVDPAYRRDPSTAYLVHDTVRGIIGRAKDGNGQYLFRGSNDGSDSLRVHGLPMHEDQGLDSSPASGDKPVVCGPLSYYKIRRVAGIRFKRSDQRFFEEDVMAFLAIEEADGDVLNSGGDPIKHMVMV